MWHRGALNARHDGIRDWAGGEHKNRTGHSVAFEQRVPEWDREVEREDGTTEMEEAILDFVTRDPVTDQQIYVDVTVVNAFLLTQLGCQLGLGRTALLQAKRSTANILDMMPRMVPWWLWHSSQAVAQLRKP